MAALGYSKDKCYCKDVTADVVWQVELRVGLPGSL